jgi:hypothetical protein
MHLNKWMPLLRTTFDAYASADHGHVSLNSWLALLKRLGIRGDDGTCFKRYGLKGRRLDFQGFVQALIHILGGDYDQLVRLQLSPSRKSKSPSPISAKTRDLDSFYALLSKTTRPILQAHIANSGKLTLQNLQNFLRSLNLLPYPLSLKDSQALYTSLGENPSDSLWPGL